MKCKNCGDESFNFDFCSQECYEDFDSMERETQGFDDIEEQMIRRAEGSTLPYEDEQ